MSFDLETIKCMPLKYLLEVDVDGSLLAKTEQGIASVQWVYGRLIYLIEGLNRKEFEQFRHDLEADNTTVSEDILISIVENGLVFSLGNGLIKIQEIGEVVDNPVDLCRLADFFYELPEDSISSRWIELGWTYDLLKDLREIEVKSEFCTFPGKED